jgi:hypothetical protein
MKRGPLYMATLFTLMISAAVLLSACGGGRMG